MTKEENRARGARRTTEFQVRALLEEGDATSAAEAAIAAYGAELFGFLTAAVGDAPARNAYATLVEELRAALLRFGWWCELRTFLYHLARRAARRDDRSSAIRRRLSLDDRELLVLRVDRRLDWLELAQVSLGERATEHDLEVFADQLRERFVRVRREIARLAPRRR